MSMLAVTLVDASVQRSESLPKLIQEYGATCPTLSSVQYLMTLTILSFALCVDCVVLSHVHAAPNWSTSVHAALVPGVRLGIETLMMIHTCPGCCAVYPGIALIPCELLFLIFEELVQQEAMERVSGMLAKLECTQDEEVAAPGAEL